MTRPGPGGPRDGGINGGRAVVLIAVLAILAIAVLARSNSRPAVTTKTTSHHAAATTATTAQHTSPSSTTSTTVLPASQVKVQVLNGVLTGSLAGQWSAKLKTDGYVTEPPDDATAKVASSEIYVLTPGYQPEAQALAATVGLPSAAVNPTVPPPTTAPIPAAERATANLVLIIGPDLASKG
ncbi:MAG TPA: LytR C-terminal domain-containing protein [Acidimicrobiales bacterium]|nr:LytR C-terminal domain-containing protein [Acidimicrobiales bacterium]